MKVRVDLGLMTPCRGPGIEAGAVNHCPCSSVERAPRFERGSCVGSIPARGTKFETISG